MNSTTEEHTKRDCRSQNTPVTKRKYKEKADTALLTSIRQKPTASAECMCHTGRRAILRKAPTAICAVYFSGMFSRVFVSRVQNGSIVGMRQRSPVVCGERIVGPNDTTSSCGYLPRMIEHSNPA